MKQSLKIYYACLEELHGNVMNYNRHNRMNYMNLKPPNKNAIKIAQPIPSE